MYNSSSLDRSAMSSRALRRLQEDGAVIRVPARSQEVGEEGDDDPIEEDPGFAASRSRKPAVNPFAMVRTCTPFF